MTPPSARTLMIHEYEAAEATVPRRRELALTPLADAPARRHLYLAPREQDAPPSLLRREQLRRWLLAAADALATAVALYVVMAVAGNHDPGLAMLAGAPLVVPLFKIAGLYDRDQMRLVHSTLDE